LWTNSIDGALFVLVKIDANIINFTAVEYIASVESLTAVSFKPFFDLHTVMLGDAFRIRD